MISKIIMKQIERYSLQQLPHEACGLMLGRALPASLIVDRFIGIPNIADNPRDHFVMEPSHFIPYLFSLERQSDHIIGVVHSHPSAPALPSSEDLSTPWSHLPSHWIVSLLNTLQPEWRAYRYSPNPTNSNIQYTTLSIQVIA